MKTRKLKAKLSLNKQTITNMTMTNLIGGITIHYLPTDADSCNLTQVSPIQPAPALQRVGSCCADNDTIGCNPASNNCGTNDTINFPCLPVLSEGVGQACL